MKLLACPNPLIRTESMEVAIFLAILGVIIFLVAKGGC